MDHYFIIISTQHLDGVHIVNALKEKVSESQSVLPKHLTQLRSTTTKYINIYPCHASKWKNLDYTDFNDIDNLCQTSNSTQKISLRLHKLADSLPITGSYLLDVIWIFDFSCDDIAVNHHLELFGSLKRLSVWHNSNTHLLAPKSETNNTKVHQWAQVLHAKISTEDEWLDSLHQINIWHGNVKFLGKLGMVLRNFSISYSGSNDCDLEISDKSQMKLLNYSTQMEVLSSCPVHNVPLHLLSNEKFVLTLVNSNTKCSSILRKWLKISGDKKEAIILRLSYTEQISSTILEFSTSSESWEETIRNETSAVSFPAFVDATQQLTFVIFPDSSETDIILRRLYQPSEINGFIASKTCYLSRVSVDCVDTNTKETVLSLLRKLPHCTEKIVQNFVMLVLKVHLTVLKHIMDMGHSIDAKRDLTTEIINCMFHSLDFSKAKRTKNILQDAEFTPLNAISNEINWPERLALMCSFSSSEYPFIQNREITNSSADNALANDSSSVLNYFSCTGDVKTNVPLQRIISKQNTSVFSLNPQMTENKLNQMTWPEIAQCRHPDIYYNKDKKSEELEWKCCELKIRHISNETHSAFVASREEPKSIMSSEIASNNVEEISLDLSKESNLTTPRKRYRNNVSSHLIPLRRSPRKKSSTTEYAQPLHSGSQNATLRRSPRKHVSSNAIMAKRVKEPPSRKRLRTETPEKSKRNKSIPSNDVCNYKDSENRIQKEHASNIRHRKDPADSYRLKLRAVVVDALVQRGVTEKHPLYQICGKKLLVVCNAFGKDLMGQSGLTDKLRRIANAHVKQVVAYEKDRAKLPLCSSEHEESAF